MIHIKGLRRTIIVICLIVLAITGFLSIPSGKYYNAGVKKLVKENEAEVIEVGKSMKIDNDKIFINRIINTEDETYIRYKFIRFEQGWSFPEGDIKVFDDKLQEYLYHGSQSSGKLWGQEGIFRVDRIPDDVQYITLKLDRYDRKAEMKISLVEEGEKNEN